MTKMTEIVCVIDNSGSMEMIKRDAIGGFNSFIESQRKIEGDAKVSIYLFNSRTIQVADCMDINDVTLLDENTYVTGGMTAMNDALGTTLDSVGQRITSMPASERPDKVVFCILTDGDENSSKEYTTTHVKDQIMHRQTNFNWEFVFLAANQDALKTGADYAFSPKSTFNFEATGDGIRSAYDDMDTYVTTVRS